MSDEGTARVAHLTGGCQCGAVRYAMYRAPKVGICHCRMCQKAVGGPFGVYAMLPLVEFAWTRGAPASWASSSIATRDFCAACGTPLAYREVGGSKMEVLTGTLDQPERAPPTGETGIESKLPWLDKLAHLPGRTTTDNRGPAAAPVVSHQHPDRET